MYAVFCPLMLRLMTMVCTNVKNLLLVKHPQQRPLSEFILLNGQVNDVSPIIVTGSAIHSAAFRTQGAHGPSGVDSAAWKHLFCSFQNQSADLCNAFTALSKCICSEFVDPKAVEDLVACRLIPLDNVQAYDLST